MNRTFIALIAVLLIGGGLYLVGTEYSEKQEDGSSTAVMTGGKQVMDFGYADAEKLVQHLNPKQRQAVLKNPALFQQAINAEVTRRAKLMAARDSGLDKNKSVQYHMQRQSEDVLLGAYMRARLQAADMPKGFPSEKQIRAYYNNKKADFILEKRLPVWQIFWSIPKGASKLTEADIVKKASTVSSSIKAGKQEFHAAALKHSEHQPSRLKGGFMGMLKVSELLSPIKDKLLALEEGEVSSPIRRDEGVHVFLRGAFVPQTQLTLEQVRPAIIRALKKNYREQQQRKLNQLLRKKYPAQLKDTDVEKWRTKMVQSGQQAKPVSAKK